MAEPAPHPAPASKPLHEPDEEKRGIGRSLRDIILGGQDGLVNVLGLVLGVAAATAQLRIIVAAGLAATFSESIAMGGVMYTSASSRSACSSGGRSWPRPDGQRI